jgi:hypothetical protein
MPFEVCSSCGSEHLPPVPCGLSFIERLRSTQVHGSVLASRTEHSRYDHEAIDMEFGKTAKERKAEFYEDTRGLGVMKDVPGGKRYKDRKTGDIKTISDDQLIKEFSVPK